VSVNVGKTKCMEEAMAEHSLLLKGMPLEWVCQYKYLGIIIDRQLNFRGHVSIRKLLKRLIYCTNYNGYCLEKEKNYCLN
jgi:hypothetical protein